MMDLVKKNILLKCINDVLIKTGFELSEEDAMKIVRAQSSGVRHAMDNKWDAKIPYIGKFKIKPGREEGIEASKEAAALGLKGEERREFLREKKRINDLKVTDKLHITGNKEISNGNI